MLGGLPACSESHKRIQTRRSPNAAVAFDKTTQANDTEECAVSRNKTKRGKKPLMLRRNPGIKAASVYLQRPELMHHI